jgi:acyl carrier protein
MSEMPTKDEVYEKIKVALTDALGVDDEDIKPEATLVGDLGAESIDFLDIVFRLEKAFDIKIPRNELFPEDVLTDQKYVQDGRVTDLGVAELRKRMPFADLDGFAKNPVVQDFANVLTVADMCRFVESKVPVTD